MIKRLCLIMVAVFSFAPLAAQPNFQWLQSNPVVASQFYFAKTLLASGSGTSFWHARLDTISSNNQQGGSYAIRRVDASGTVFSQFQLGNKVDITEIEEIGGDVLVSGVFYDSLSINGIFLDADTFSSGFINNVTFIARLTATGNVVWYRNLTSYAPFGLNLFCMGISPSGKVYYGSNQPGSGTRVIRLNGSTGFPTDSFVVAGAVNVSDIGFDNAGNLFIVGAAAGPQLWQIGSFAINVPYSYAIYVAQVLPGNIVKWVRFTEDTTFPRPQLLVNGDGSSYVVGKLFAPTQWDNISLGGAQWVNDFYLVRIDSAGFAVWARELALQQPAITGDFNLSLGRNNALSENQQVTLFGTVRGTVDFGNSVTTPAATTLQAHTVFVTFDSTGSPLWSKSVPSLQTATAPVDIMYQDSAWYSTITIGQTNSFSLDSLSINTTAAVNNVLSRLSNLSVVPTSVYENNFIEALPYPNPATDEFFLPLVDMDRIEVMEANGKLISVTFLPTADGAKVFVHQLAAGFYIGLAYDRDNKTKPFRFQVVR
ncbi:MAG: hypothetical protein ACK5DJ_06540 [Bacteroidota bacterium]|jgi:hypothetical protein